LAPQVQLRSATPDTPGPAEEAHPGLQELLHDARRIRPSHDLALISRAFHVAELAHRGQLRLSGDPSITHILAVGRILVELNQDTTTVAAGLLHEVLDDRGIPESQITAEFGEDIARLVQGVAKIRDLDFSTPEAQQAESFRKLLLTMAQDLRVVLVKFADRLHNMRTLAPLPPEMQEQMARESRDIYAPLAHRLGIARIREELEDLSLKWLEPEAYREVREKTRLSRDERESYLSQVREPLRAMLQEAGIDADIHGRPKSFYSIYRKMRTRAKSFEEIYDLLAVRIIVSSVPECYHVLGMVHAAYTPVMSRFKDFVATPKSNMYQSLHTTVIGPGGNMLEIQIRTQDMHQTAEVGIAAHWLYKEHKSGQSSSDRQMAWLRQRVREWQSETADPHEFIEDLKTDLFPDEVYVFTPKGDLIQLPEGATPIDFAFAVHTEVGLHCIGAKVDGQIVPLSTPLTTGSEVEVTTSPHQRPNRDWLNTVKSSKARARIRRWLREAEHTHSVELGEEILSRELKKRREKVADEALKRAAADLLDTQSVESLYAAIGNGELSIGKVTHRLFPEARPAARKGKGRPSSARPPTGSALRVHGLSNLMVQYAGCCRPIPGDAVLGVITRGRGVSVHRRDCPNIRTLSKDPERILELDWESEQRETYNIQIRVCGIDRPNFLRDVTHAIAEMGVHIVEGQLKTTDGEVGDRFTVEIADTAQLNGLVKAVSAVSGVTAVERVHGSASADARPLFQEADEGNGSGK